MKKTNLSNKIANSNLILKIRKWAASHRKSFWIICALISILVGGLVSFVVFSSIRPEQTDKSQSVKTKKRVAAVKYYSPLTGNLVDNEAATLMPVTGVMIPNDTYGARPQSGLKSAGVVFEAICEGGITRLLALFQQDKPQLIGPIRSVRMYYISWAAPFNAGIAHVGGNADALAEIRNGNYRDLDQFANSEAYWRDNNRSAPDNMYTSGAKLDALNTAKGYIQSQFTGFSRIDGKASASPTATTISVNISSESFNSSYTYDPVTNTYARSQGGAPHLDTEGQITPSSIVVMTVEETSSSVPESHEEITTIGTGPVKIFQNGEVIEGTWHKSSQFDQLFFTDANEKDIPLVRGQTWITAIPSSTGSVTYTAPAPVEVSQ